MAHTPLTAMQIELGKNKAGKALVERSEAHHEVMVQQNANRSAGLTPEQRPMNQGSVTRNGRQSRRGKTL